MSPTYVTYTSAGSIAARITTNDPAQAASYPNILAISSYDYYVAQPELWGVVLSNTIRLAPQSSCVAGTLTVVGAAAQTEVCSVSGAAIFSNANTPRIVISFVHALSLVNCQQANVALYDRKETLVYSAGFGTSNVAAVFSASVVAVPGIGQYNLKLSIPLVGVNMNVSSRVLIVRDSTL